MAGRAGRIDAGHEQQLDADEAFALAVLAAPLGNVEGETPGIEAFCLGLFGGGEQLAHMVEQAGVGGQVGAGRTADRLLVDLHQAPDAAKARAHMPAAGLFRFIFQALLFGLVALGGMAQVRTHQLQQGLADQARLARTGNTGNGGKAAQRELRTEVVQVVAADAFELQPVVGLA
ncbi:hypothetical protein D3C79_617010 [compost metagenome]